MVDVVVRRECRVCAPNWIEQIVGSLAACVHFPFGKAISSKRVRNRSNWVKGIRSKGEWCESALNELYVFLNVGCGRNGLIVFCQYHRKNIKIMKCLESLNKNTDSNDKL